MGRKHPTMKTKYNLKISWTPPKTKQNNKTTTKKTQKLRLEYENPNKNKEGYAEGIITSAGSKTPDHLTDDSRSSTNYMLYQKWIFFGGFGADSSNSGLKCN